MPLLSDRSIPSLPLFHSITIGGGITIGAIANLFIERKYQYKQQLAKFSKAKSDFEKFQVKTDYKIKAEILINHNKVIERTINLLKTNQELPDFDIEYSKSTTKVFNPKDKVNSLWHVFDIKMHELDKLSTQKITCECIKKSKLNYLSFFAPASLSMVLPIFPIAISACMGNTVNYSLGILCGIAYLPPIVFSLGYIISKKRAIKRKKEVLKRSMN